MRFVGNAMAVRFGTARGLLQHFGGGFLENYALGAAEAPGAGAFWGKHAGSPVWNQTGSSPAFRGRFLRRLRSEGVGGSEGAGAFGGKHDDSPVWNRAGSSPAFRGRFLGRLRSGGVGGPGGGCVRWETRWQSGLEPHGFFISISGEVS